MSLLLFSVAAVLLSLTPSGAQTPPQPPPLLRQRCARPPEGQWISDVSVKATDPAINSGRLRWNLDNGTADGASYEIVYRNVSAGIDGDEPYMIRRQSPRSPAGMFTLKGLIPGTMYEMMVCRPGFKISMIPPPTRPGGGTPFIADCGFCITGYTTEAVFYDFDMTSVTRINATYVRLVCQVISNIPQFFINWSISDPMNASKQTLLDNGGIIGEQPISIVNNRQGSRRLVSTLTAPNNILERDVLCTAKSKYKSESSRGGAFTLIEGMAPNNNLPVWAISIVAVVCLLTLVCLLVAAALIIGLLCTCSRTRTRKFVATELKRKVSESNEYLEAKIGLHTCKMSLEEMSYKGKEIYKETDLKANSNGFSESALREVLMDDLIIDSSLLKVTTIIGQGEYGVVYKGLLRKGTVDEIVAVKSLKGIFASESDIQAVVQEIVKMKEFNHTNVMLLIGVSISTSFSGGAPLIIMPYMARGSLLSYLRKERDQLKPGANTDLTQVGAVQKLLMHICLQISKGMLYLATLRFVHRDLAARNCMIDEKGVIKVADFGLAEDIYMRNYFRQSSQDTVVKLPLKWMAPESIKLGIFSEKSDVWSYGVTCWEVFTAGEIPYQGVHAQEVIQLLEDGKHLPRPRNQACSDNMFAMMRSCWAYNAEDRPNFASLSSQVDTELTALADYVDLSMFTGEGTATGVTEE